MDTTGVTIFYSVIGGLDFSRQANDGNSEPSFSRQSTLDGPSGLTRGPSRRSCASSGPEKSDGLGVSGQNNHQA